MPVLENYRRKNHHIRNRRLIKMNDRKTKMDLQRKFDLKEIQEIDNTTPDESCSKLHKVVKISNTVTEDDEILLPKLPAGTILIKQCNNSTNKNELTEKSMAPAVNEIESATPRNIEKIKSTYASDKINQRIQMRRNPIRGTKKKIDDTFTRPRLLTAKRRSNNDHESHVVDKKQMKLSNVPYMNTRSVTKKMYNVGATHQAPTITDEIEWREWPIHGMHERPIYHPQMGLAVECIGQKFVSVDGFSYQEVSQLSHVKIPHVNFKLQQPNLHTNYKKINRYYYSPNVEDSFENCMHESLHSVLAYAAKITTSQYRKMINKYKLINVERITDHGVKLACLQESNTNCGLDPSKLQTPKPPLNLKCIKNHAKLQKVLERGSKNTLILLKTTDPSLKKENICVINKSGISSSTLIPVKVESDIDNDHIILKQTSSLSQLSLDDSSQDTKDASKNPLTNINGRILSTPLSNVQSDEENDLTHENWIEELIGDTAILYCAATGIHQDDFAMYLNTLDAKQCINWIDTGY